MSTEMNDLESLLMVERLSSEIVSRIYVYVKPGDPPKIFGVLGTTNSAVVEAGFEEHVVESRWTIPSRRQMEDYRREAATVSRQTGMVLIDEMRLADEVVAHHLKKLLMDGKEIELSEDPERPGRIAQDALEKLKGMHSGFYDTFYTQYQSEACLLK